MFPRLHGENSFSPFCATGLMMYWAFALQELAVRGQQALVELQPSAHYNIIFSPSAFAHTND
jgi:hypothetical protein